MAYKGVLGAYSELLGFNSVYIRHLTKWIEDEISVHSGGQFSQH